MLVTEICHIVHYFNTDTSAFITQYAITHAAIAEVVNPRHETAQGQPVTKPRTPLQIIAIVNVIHWMKNKPLLKIWVNGCLVCSPIKRCDTDTFNSCYIYIC